MKYSIRDWSVRAGGEKGTDERVSSVILYEYRGKTLLAALAFEAVDTLCAKTGHLLCGGSNHEWLWKIPLGRPRYEVDEDGTRWLDNSLGGMLYNKFTDVYAYLDDRLQKGVVREIAITEEELQAIAPDFGSDDLDQVLGYEK